MSVSLTPPAAPKKKGMGCLACGCVVLVLLAFLFFGLVASLTYVLYAQILSHTSAEPSTVQTFDGGDDVYNSAKQKLSDFDHDLHAHLAATIHLSADEINTLIAHTPDFDKNKIHLFVTMAHGEATTQISLPVELFTRHYLFKGRYLNAETTFGLNFDSTAKMVLLDLQALQINGEDLPKDNLPLIQTELNPGLNQMLQGLPDGKSILDQAKSIEIKDNELVIEIQ